MTYAVEIQESETWGEVSGHGRQEREGGREGRREEERLTGSPFSLRSFIISVNL